MSDLLRWEPVDAEHPLTDADDLQVVEDNDVGFFAVFRNFWTADGQHKDDANRRIKRILRPVTDPDGEWHEVNDANPLTEADAGPSVRVRGKDWEVIGFATWDQDSLHPFNLAGQAWKVNGVWARRDSCRSSCDITHIYRPKPTRPTWKQISKTEWDFGGRRLIKVFDIEYVWLNECGALRRACDAAYARKCVEEVWGGIYRALREFSFRLVLGDNLSAPQIAHNKAPK